ncbi:hypothetical protein LJR220_004010 [Bradyrhizobium sp. LjRoot220]|uniref:hypothetical protein n=1 Tax=Bradyrhizobium sp. LjRoot220 TaxID=3342284 RepID=UPI003ECC53E8
MLSAGQDLLRFADKRRFGTIMADPPWQFTNKTGKVAPEHKRLARYGLAKSTRFARYLCLKSRRRQRICTVVSECDAAGWPRGHEGVGLYLQVQYRLAQGTEGLRARTYRVLGFISAT